tara:strand:+ start:464 stop:778 length:315 start_codon:yes stop_codon:yes gene_type:complete
MKSKKMVTLMNIIFDSILQMHKEGQKEYAHDEDNVFANFDRVANQTNTDKKFVLWIYLMKHIDGIASYINGHKSQREDVRGRITDALVYLIILWAMINEDEGIN